MQRTTYVPGLVKFLYNHNPFYLISACFVLYGLRQAFYVGEGELLDTAAAMAALCGYTLLTAVTGFLVVKLGRVWEDARSIVLVLLFFFMAISVSCDELANLAPAHGRALLAIGFGFAVFISEFILCGLNIRFPAEFRIPYYVLLALFFGYPMWLSSELTGAATRLAQWRVFLFPCLAALAFLLLLPAVRRGSAYVAENGTPWKWPLFPWTVFGFLGAAAAFRSYVLTISFLPSYGSLVEMHSAFGLYFLAPLLLALLVILLEIGIVERKPGLERFVLLAAPALMVISLPHPLPNRSYLEFLDIYREALGSPLWVAVVGMTSFYGWAALRRVRGANVGVVASLLLLGVVARNSGTLAHPTDMQPWALAVVGIQQAWVAVRGRRSMPACVALVSLALAAMAQFRGAPLAEWHPAIAFHAVLLGLIVVAAAFDDFFAHCLRGILSLVIAAEGCLLLAAGTSFELSLALRLGAVAALSAVGFAAWRLLGAQTFLFAGIVNVAAAAGWASWSGYLELLREVDSRVVVPLTWGAVCFVVAALISAAKGGSFRRWLPEPVEVENGGPPPPD